MIDRRWLVDRVPLPAFSLAVGITFIQSGPVTRTLLDTPLVPGTVTVTSVQESPTDIVVQIDGPGVTCPHFGGDTAVRNNTLLSGMILHVWLLRSDGEASAQRRPPTHISVDNAGCTGDSMQFYFRPVRPSAVAGVALSVNGTLSVQKVDAP